MACFALLRQVESLEQCRALSTLTQLTSLEFRGGVLTQLPSHLSSLAELRSLTLDDCHLRIRGHVGKHLKRLPRCAHDVAEPFDARRASPAAARADGRRGAGAPPPSCGAGR